MGSVVRIFVAGPIGWLETEEIQKARDEALRVAKERIRNEMGEEAEIEVLDSTFGAAEGKHPAVYFIGRAIQEMSKADIVLFPKGWEDFKTCRFEFKVAFRYRLKVMDMGAEG